MSWQIQSESDEQSSLRPSTADSRAEAMLKALRAGEICLAPTDTLPGLSFDPTRETAAESLRTLKGRPERMGFVGLVAELGQALRCWQNLPASWHEALLKLWPAPLSVIFAASHSCPTSLLAPDGTVALRQPRLREQDRWLHEVMRGLGQPLPSSSVNHHGEEAAGEWIAAVRWARVRHVAIPVEACSMCPERNLPSTLIQITGPKEFTVLRVGALSSSVIEAALA